MASSKHTSYLALSCSRPWAKATETTVSVPFVTASPWRVDDGEFAVVADISSVLDEHGDGVYRIVVWALIDDEAAIISEYSIFHGISAPDTYSDPQE